MKELSDISGQLKEPEPRPGVYQSRVFTFFQRQAHRVRDGLGLGWRQVRVSVKMTGQLFLLPLRWLQRLTPERQFSGRSPAPVLPPEPTIAIERILAEVAAAGQGRLAGSTSYEDWSAIDDRDWDVSLLDNSQRPLTGFTERPTKTPVIRGLASRLADRHLVLIDDRNHMLDTLSPSQQWHIRQKISPDLPVPTSPQSTSSATPELPGSGSRSLSTGKSFANGTDIPGSTNFWSALPSSRIPTTPWQKATHWLSFYRDYWRVTEEPEDVEESPAPTVTPWTPDPVLDRSPGTVGALARMVAAPTVQDRPFQTEWIDAPTRPLGYERSWLVRCLEWLDGVLLAIENWIASLYQRLFHRS
jgi:hypothetical protein